MSDLEKYQEWNKELETVAVQKFLFDVEVIQDLTAGHVFHDCFEKGMTPFDAVMAYQNNEF